MLVTRPFHTLQLSIPDIKNTDTLYLDSLMLILNYQLTREQWYMFKKCHLPTFFCIGTLGSAEPDIKYRLVFHSTENHLQLF